jgi:hypothetical protein
VFGLSFGSVFTPLDGIAVYLRAAAIVSHRLGARAEAEAIRSLRAARGNQKQLQEALAGVGTTSPGPPGFTDEDLT